MQAHEEQLAVRCINDVENLHQVNSSNSIPPIARPNLDSSNQLEFDISIISNHSSTLSDFNPKSTQKKNLEAKSQTTTTNSSIFKFDSGLTKSNFDDFDLEYDKSKEERIKKNQTDSALIENVISDYIDSAKGDLDMINKAPEANFGDRLVQGHYVTTGNSDISMTYVGFDDDEVNVVRANDDMSKVRSQFIQRFSTNNAVFSKRHIIPNFVEPPQQPTNEHSEGHQAFNLNSSQQKILSQVAMNAVSEPLLKIQNALEAKISTVIGELEMLKRAEAEQSNFKFNHTNFCKQAELHDEFEEYMTKNLEANLREDNLERIKYLENLQEKQFDIMSQLISMIGKENTNANMTASSGRESLNRIREQCQLIEPEFQDGADVSFDGKMARAKNSHASLKNQKNKKGQASNGGQGKNDGKKSRSRSRNRTKSSRSLSGVDSESGCGVCLPRRQVFEYELSIDKSPKKKAEFLEELLGNSRQKSPEKKVEDAKLSSKSASVFSENIYDSQPTLFDKYLDEAKSKNLKHDDREQSNKLPSTSSAEAKPSMFNDIKEVLKAVEFSKAQIDDSLADLIRARDIKIFNLPNYHLIEKNDRIRLKKLVDGCVSAISNDVQKEVTQRLVDESKHVKLEAERDLGSYRKKTASSVASFKSKSTVGFGSSASRSANATDKKLKLQSDTQKYIGKVFGKALLDKIKLEDLEEHNEKIRKQLEEQKELKRQLTLQKQQQGFQQPQSRLFKNLSNSKRPSKVETKPLVKENLPLTIPETISKETTNHNTAEPIVTPRPAFQSCQYQTDDKSDKNIALVTVIQQEPAPSKPPKELKRQNLPSLCINPIPRTDLSCSEPAVENKANQSSRSESTNSSIDLNQSGAGIHLPGYEGTLKQQTVRGQGLKPTPSITKNTFVNAELNQMSSDAEQVLKGRNMLEKEAFNWIEAELISKFINNLASEQQNNKNLLEFDDVISDNGLDNESNNQNTELNILGAEGLRLITDLGSQIDPDFVEALIRECLEEKIAQEMRNEAKQPVASPRKRSVDKNKQSLNLNFDSFDKDKPIETPITTPQDEVIDAIPGNYTIGTQVSFESPQPPQPPVPQLPATQPVEQKIEPTKIINYYEDPETLLEETLTDQDGVCFQVTNYDEEEFNQIYNPRTPDETPVRTPSPDEFDTPTLSQTTPTVNAPSPSPKPQTKSTSMQCDPDTQEPETPEPIAQPLRKPKLVKQEVQVEVFSDQSDVKSEDLTESTLYTSTDDTSTSSTLSQYTNTTRTECSSLNEGDSYFSEGAWLLSKSEGQIIQTYQDHTESKRALLARQLRKGSVGEVQLDERPLSGCEAGEILVKKLEQTNSEGEVLRPLDSNSKSKHIVQPFIAVETFEKLKHSTSKMSSKSSKKKKKDKTQVDLSISPQKAFQRNNIQIQSIPNEILVRDSADIERKIYSSTPDQSMFVVQALDTFVDDEEDFSNYTNYEDDNEIELEVFDEKDSTLKNKKPTRKQGNMQ